MEKRELEPGDVVQFNEETRNKLFIGALAIVSEPKNFGALVGVHGLGDGTAYYRATYAELEYIGRAVLMQDQNDV